MFIFKWKQKIPYHKWWDSGSDTITGIIYV